MIAQWKSLTAAAAVLCMATGQAEAADKMTLKFTHAFSATHKQWVHGGAVLQEALKGGNGPEIELEHYPASQLGKEHTSLISAGLAQAGIIAPSYEPDKLPLTSVAELPGLVSGSCQGSGKLWHLVKEGGIVDQEELKPLGLIALYVNMPPPYSVLTSAKEVTSLEDMEGLKIRAAGAAMDRTARLLKSAPISVTASELYDSLSRGTIDGGFLSIEVVKGLGLDGVLKYALDGVKIGTAVTVGVMNRRTWDRLDEATKVRVRDAGLKTQRAFCEWYEQAVADASKDLTDRGVMKINAASAEEVARWDAALADVAKAWAADLDKSGRRGSDVLAAFMAAPSDF